ncbi:MAG: MarR family transcriptional regulator [Marinicella sp.]
MDHSTEGALLTEIVLDIFKLNGLLILEGDQLSKEHGLTSARWKVLGALAPSDTPLTVSDVAKLMGLTRQAIQRLVNEMETLGLLELKANPKHKRAKLLSLTQKGMNSYELMTQKQIPWVNEIAAKFDNGDLQQMQQMLVKLIGLLDIKS